MHSDSRNEHRPPVLSPSPVITSTKYKSRGLLADLAGWPSYSDMRIQAPSGGEKCGDELHQSAALTSETPPGAASTLGSIQKSTHLPTPQSPGNRTSYLLTRTPTSNTLQPDHESNALPTEFRSHVSPSPPPFRPHSIPTPDPSPLVARSRSHGLPSQLARTDDSGSATPSKWDGLQSRASTPLRTPSRQASTRPVTPVLQSRPTTPLQQWRLTERLPPGSSHLNNATSPAPQKIKDESGVIRAQLIENNLATTQATEPHRPDYFKRMRRLAPSNTSLTSDLGGKDGSLIWSSTNMGVIDSPIKGKRIALFQETSEESFEESLMAGGYGRYRSDRPWKPDAEAPNQLGDAVGEAGLGSGLVLTEEEKRKKTRLDAFFNPPRVSCRTPLLPVEIEGCGRVLMKIEPSEPQTPLKPTPKAKRSRKRKKASADMKYDVEMDSVAAPEVHTVDGPNWPDTEFPWRSRFMASDGLSSMEREERMRYIESFLDRESDEDDVGEGHSSSGRHTPEVRPRTPRSGGGKIFPLLSHSKDRRPGSALGVIPDPADAKTALLCKKSIQAVQLRLLRRRNTYRNSDSDDGEPLCICQGRDDGRPLVQCDACRTWYHLACIGIQSTSELGKEEDPWFCANCVEVKTPPPVAVPLTEPTFTLTEDGEGDVGYNPFLNAGFHPSPATPWTRRTPPRILPHTPHGTFGSSWDEPPSSSSRGDPRTPQFGTASGFGDTVRVYGMTPGRLVEPQVSSGNTDGFDPTSTPSRGIMFGLPFTTPKEGRWGLGSLHGIRGGGPELFHTPKRPGEDGGAASMRQGQHYHGRVGEVSEEGPSGVQGLFRANGINDVTPVERDGGVPKRMQVLESPLGGKRSRRRVDD